ncbi:MAG: lipoyl(octanoyl) transferase LipB [Deltaproteobacteria bacterium]|nr:lipoyl(octanoyl) transferase LipB [Deltaproteobacteria bacterium]
MRASGCDDERVRVVDLGADVSYAEGVRHQRAAAAAVDTDGPVLFLLEHAAVITITRRGGTTHVFSSRERLAALGIELCETDRGGDVTFHGPGQLVGYPVLRLGPSSLGSDVVGYVHDLEAGLVDACRALGVHDAHAKPERDAAGNHLTGVWCRAPDDSTDAKLCAIGVGLSGGVTRHGFALNVDIEVERFLAHMVPCGLAGRGVTSLARVLGAAPSMARVRELVAHAVIARVGARAR